VRNDVKQHWARSLTLIPQRATLHPDPRSSQIGICWCLCVFRHHIEIPVAFEHAGVEQFELRIVLAAPIFLDELSRAKRSNRWQAAGVKFSSSC
jgi:hypothetical protein